MKKLTDIKYWDIKYSTKQSIIAKLIQKLSSLSLFYYDLKTILRKHVPKNKEVLEIGCAPGVRLINLSKDLHLNPKGMDYSERGVKESKLNFKKAGLDPNSIFLSDFFDDKFIEENKEKFDIVMSYGFIEHFDDTKSVIERHSKILKKDGILVISIPNLKSINKFFIPSQILEKHNLKIMNLNSLKKKIPEDVKILSLKYYGGPFNIGSFFYKNKILELLRKSLFMIQRIIIDPIFILFYKLGLNLNNKFSSPGIILIGVKRK